MRSHGGHISIPRLKATQEKTHGLPISHLRGNHSSVSVETRVSPWKRLQLRGGAVRAIPSVVRSSISIRGIMHRVHINRALRATGILIVGAGLLTELPAQSGIPTPSAYRTIKEAEIKADMFALAGDGLRGREAGTLDEMH